MKTGYDLGFLVKNDEKEPSNRKDWKIFGRILLFLHGKRTESSNNQKQRQEYGSKAGSSLNRNDVQKAGCWPKEKEISVLVADVRHFDVVKKV